MVQPSGNTTGGQGMCVTVRYLENCRFLLQSPLRRMASVPNVNLENEKACRFFTEAKKRRSEFLL